MIGEGEEVVDAGSPNVGAEEVTGSIEVGDDLLPVVDVVDGVGSFGSGGFPAQHVVGIGDR